VTFDELVASRRDRLRAVVLIGADQAPLREALDRHAPEVPAMAVDPGDTGTVMNRAVQHAYRLAGATEGPATALLAPACASTDQFTSHAERGDTFAAAVRALVPDVAWGRRP
jgi:UDP-N-acetylmuramoylalanine--D-glutamate ligase